MIITNLTDDIKLSGPGIAGEITITKKEIRDISIDQVMRPGIVFLNVTGASNPTSYEIPFARVTSPSTASLEALRDKLIEYKNANSYASATVSRSGSQSLTAGAATTITFSSPIGTSGTSYTLYINCYSGASAIAYSVSSRTSAGFTVTAIANCTIEWAAIQTS